MVSKSLDIHTADLQPFEPGAKRLLLEISPLVVTVILWDNASQAPEAVEVFNGAHNETDDWKIMLQQSRLLGFTDLDTLVYVANPEMIPIPASLYHPATAKAQLELFFGNKNGDYYGGDIMETGEMVVAWQLPGSIHGFLTGHFKVLRIQHVVSALIGKNTGDLQAEGLIVVYAVMAWVLLWQEGRFQIAMPVSFSQPDDLSWNLLNLCRQLGLSPTAVHWSVSGMVEDVSPLWQAVTRFLDPVEPLPARVRIPDELPAHYFAHLLGATGKMAVE